MALVQTWAILAVCVLMPGTVVAQEDAAQPVIPNMTLLDDTAIKAESESRSESATLTDAEKGERLRLDLLLSQQSPSWGLALSPRR